MYRKQKKNNFTMAKHARGMYQMISATHKITMNKFIHIFFPLVVYLLQQCLYRPAKQNCLSTLSQIIFFMHNVGKKKITFKILKCIHLLHPPNTANSLLMHTMFYRLPSSLFGVWKLNHQHIITWGRVYC